MEMDFFQYCQFDVNH